MVSSMQVRRQGLSKEYDSGREPQDCGDNPFMADEDDPYYLALDPGKATGWSTWDKRGIWLDKGTVWDYDELHDLLAGFPITIKIVIVEDFKLFGNKARSQVGSRMPASLSIGRIETFAKLWGATLIKQPSNVKPIAEKLTGQSTKGLAHSKTHVLDAFNAGEYWLIKNQIKKVKL